MKPAYIGARVPQALRDELIEIARLLQMPYSDVLALLLSAGLPTLRVAAERSGKRDAA